MEAKEVRELMEAYASVYSQIDEAAPTQSVDYLKPKIPAGTKVKVKDTEKIKPIDENLQNIVKKGLDAADDFMKTPVGQAIGNVIKPVGQGRKTPNKPGGNWRPAPTVVKEEDLFDIIKGHLLDEGYADSEEAAIAIMSSMSEEWRQSILSEDPVQDFRDRERAKENAAGKRGPELSHGYKGTPKPGSAATTNKPRGREFTNPPS